MPYTYDDFMSASRKAGMADTFSDDDLVTAQRSPEYGLSMLKLKKDAASAKTPEQRLLVQEAQNQLRSTYAVPSASGTGALQARSATTGLGSGTSGSITRTASPGGRVDYSDKLLGELAQYKDYKFDADEDEGYQGIRETYLGDVDASGDKLRGNRQVDTGSGMPDYAANAAGQAGSYGKTKLTDILPSVEENAYQRYLQEYGLKSDQAKIAGANEEFEFQKWLQQQNLDLEDLQQQYENDLLLHQKFGQDAPTMPDLGAGAAGEGSEYSYGKEKEYQDLLSKVLNREDFSYDQNTDPIYGSVRKSIMREGDRASQDALARASAGSGGVPSSYAIRLAADTGNAYAQQLMEAMPELQSNAYSRYLDDFGNDVEALGLLESDRNQDYNQWLQALQLERSKKQQEFENAITQYEITGMTPDIASVLGIEYVPPTTGSGESKSGGGAPQNDKGKSGYAGVLGDVINAKRSGATPAELSKLINKAIEEGKIHPNQGQGLRSYL